MACLKCINPKAPVVGGIGSSTYDFKKFLASALKDLTADLSINIWNLTTFFPRSKRFLLTTRFVSFDIVYFLTNVPVNKTLEIIELRITLNLLKFFYFALSTVCFT